MNSIYCYTTFMIQSPTVKDTKLHDHAFFFSYENPNLKSTIFNTCTGYNITNDTTMSINNCFCFVILTDTTTR